MPILHEHFEPGTMIRSMRAHHDNITALDFDAPFGLMVSAAMDDSVRVFDLNAGRCIGVLEGHTASVRTLQVEDNFLATGSMDATIRLWDLSKAHYDPQGSQFGKEEDDEDAIAFDNPDDQPVDPPAGSMSDCPLFTLEAHLDEITALNFRGNVLVSGSADKTLRQWDLEKGRCVQTLDVMWAAAQASALSTSDSGWRQTSRAPDMAAAVTWGSAQCEWRPSTTQRLRSRPSRSWITTSQRWSPRRSMVMKPKPSIQELIASTTAPGAGEVPGGTLAGKGTMSSAVPAKPLTNWLG